MSILFIGGTGMISTACTALAIEQGHDLTLLNRGKRSEPPKGVKVIEADINDEAAAKKAIGSKRWDVVVNWIAFNPEQVERDIRLFEGRCGQYVFISSASAYQKPCSTPFITESTPLKNPWWQYSRNKIACEQVLMDAHRERSFPMLIVRPSYTYADWHFPLGLHGKTNWTLSQRMLDCKPIIIPGDGMSLWTNTHNSDFAIGFNGLLGNPQTLGHAVHITQDESMTWDAIHQCVADALGVKVKIVHVPSDLLIAHKPDLAGPLLGDKSNSVVFDNSKLRKFVPAYAPRVPMAEGARRVAAWYDANPSAKTVDDEFNTWCDTILNSYRKAWPNDAAF